MKRSIFIFSLAFVLLVLAIWEQIFLDRTLFELYTKGETLVTIIESENVSSAIEYVEEIDNYWEEKEKWVILAINHDDIDKLAEQLLIIRDKLEANQVQDALEEAHLFVFYTHSCKELLVSSFNNIF